MRLGVVSTVFAVLITGCVPAPPPEAASADSSDEPPPSAVQSVDPTPTQWPERVLRGPGELQVRGYLQDVVIDRFGRSAWDEFLAAPTGIAVASLPGRWATSHAPSVNLLVRTGRGWIGRRSGGAAAAVSAEVERELDRLLGSAALWTEPNQHPDYACPDSGADVMMIRHERRTRTVYQSAGCGTPNLSSRLIATAVRERVPE